MKKLITFLFSLNVALTFSQSAPTFKWLKGADTINQVGVYGTVGVPHPNNTPGARNNSMSWKDANGNLWMFGGYGSTTTSATGLLNDLWKYDPNSNNWTWVSGSNSNFVYGTYGTLNVPSATTCPGARQNAYTWADSNGNLWLFGGQGHASAGPLTYLNDLWKYNIASNQWTWVSGASSGTATSVYGTKGVASVSNVPGGRFGGSCWIDGSNNLWLFGGQQNNGSVSRTNDLWKYDMSLGQWIWMSGSSSPNQNGVYGTKNVAAAANVPGARQASVCWYDNGNLWLFGGDGFSSSGTNNDYMNDLWKYNVSSGLWTWMSGSTTYTQGGVYGTKSVMTSSNVPGARQMSIGWIDNAGDLWLFGGWGYTGPLFGRLNDLWKYNVSSDMWVWMAGSNSTNQQGVYGTVSVPSASNVPGSRRMSVSWKDNNGKFWLMGGNGIDKNNKTSYMNDLWQIDIGVANSLNGNMTIGHLIQINPNPATDKITIRSNNEISTAQVYLIDLAGKILSIHELNEGSVEIPLSHLTPGLYIIKIGAERMKLMKTN